MLYVHRSNQVERLVRSLGDEIEKQPRPPFEAEKIVVQGRGMERWLSMELSRRFGVWANPSFPFPRGYLLELFEKVLGSEGKSAKAFEPKSLLWAIAARLPGLLDQDEFAPLKSYLDRQEDAGALLTLSERIAETLDNYVVFRAEMIAAWERRCDGSWQSVLWNRLVTDLGRNHVGAIAARLLDRLERERVDDLPARISVFGISTLAPLYTRIFCKLARTTDVHLYVLSPSEHYWGDIHSRKEELSKWIDRIPDDEDDLERVLAPEEGHRLLASLGRIGREFQAVLEGSADEYEDFDQYVDPLSGDSETRALPQLQSDMLTLIHRGPKGEEVPLSRDGDDSIVVHSCHSPMREVQVLYDQLRARLDADPALRPCDIIVMTPDIDRYAPFIEAVFDIDEEGGGIPHRIADRKPSSTNEMFDAFRELANVLQGRVTAVEVVDLLRLPMLRARFGFAAEDVEVVREWVEAVGIRWGLDGRHRASYGRPEDEQNTWAFGFKRLFLGYAMGGEDEGEFAGSASYVDVEGTDAEILGGLAELLDELAAASARLAMPLPMASWPEQVRQLVDTFFRQDGPASFQAQELRAAIEELAQRADEVGFADPLDLGSVALLIEAELRTDSLARGFLSGPVTFCELVPMRAIPFEIVCLIGMNDDAFPRSDRRPDFDQTTLRRRWGDRSLRDDDRYMFLEAVLSARRQLYVSYVGQDVHAQAPIPPSVVVQELLDTWKDFYAIADDGRRIDPDALIARHPLQAFSAKYFLPDAPHRSYSQAAYRGALALAGEATPAAPFLAAGVDWDRDGEATIDLDELVRFFENPSRSFLQRRMGVYLGRDASVLDSREPIDLDALEEWKVADPMLRRLLAGEECGLDEIARLGALPAGALGRREYERLVRTVRAIAGARDFSDTYRTVEIDHRCGECRVIGSLPQVGAGGQEYFQYSLAGKRQELSLWIRHLALCAAEPDTALRSRLVARKAAGKACAIVFDPIEAAAERLSELIDLYRRGMEHPLPLFEQASRKYAEVIAAGGSAREARARAEASFVGNPPYSRGDVDDDYVRQIYGDETPFSSERALAETPGPVATAVYELFLETRREERA